MIRYILMIFAQILRVAQVVVFIRVILTWIMPGRPPKAIIPVTNRIDLVLKRFQVLIPAGQGYIDLGPMLFFLLLEVVIRLLVTLSYTSLFYF